MYPADELPRTAHPAATSSALRVCASFLSRSQQVSAASAVALPTVPHFASFSFGHAGTSPSPTELCTQRKQHSEQKRCPLPQMVIAESSGTSSSKQISQVKNVLVTSFLPGLWRGMSGAPSSSAERSAAAVVLAIVTNQRERKTKGGGFLWFLRSPRRQSCASTTVLRGGAQRGAARRGAEGRGGARRARLGLEG
jgi:hypothetical protein